MKNLEVPLDEDVNVRDSANLMTDREIGSLIVLSDGEPVGIVTKRDMMQRVVSTCRDPCETRIKDIMSAPLITIDKDAGILTAMRKMRERKISRLVVMEGDVLKGVISERDVINAVSFASLSSFSSLIENGNQI